jgi:4-hydroxy-tetrahydrodipicolinate synthase
LAGIVPPLVTPLLGRDSLDVAGFERLIERVLAGGVHGVFVLGTSGEAPSLSQRLRREVVSRACRQVAGRVPVLVGVTDTAFVESVRLSQHAAESGASAVVLAAPYYFPAGQPELGEYLEHLVPELALPVFLYNMPAMTKVIFGEDILRRALQLERVHGLKDSSGDPDYFGRAAALARERPDWSVLVGPEHLLRESMGLGGHGGVNGGANIHPRLFVELYEAIVGGDAIQAARLEERVRQIGAIYRIGQHSSAVIKGIKCALSVLGVCHDFMAEPFHRFRDPERARVRQMLMDAGLPAAGGLAGDAP